MPFYCCSPSEFLQSHYTVLMSSIFIFNFFLAFFMHLLMLLFTSLYFSDPSDSFFFFLSSLFLSHRSRISAVIQVFFLRTMFAKDLTGCFSMTRWPRGLGDGHRPPVWNLPKILPRGRRDIESRTRRNIHRLPHGRKYI